MICRYQRIDIDDDWFFPCIFSPLFHENTPVSFIIQETGAYGKFFDKLQRLYLSVQPFCNYLPGLKLSFRLTERLNTRCSGAESLLSGQK